MKTCVSYAAMVLVQILYGASNILVKVALSKGLNQLVFVVYRHIIAMFLLAPFAYALEKTQRPSLSIPILAKIFCLSALGSTIHLNVYYAGLAYTSPTVATALANVVPSLTFPLAVLFGMEKVKMKSCRGQAKVLGTVICVGGSLAFTFWKEGYLVKALVEGPMINLYPVHVTVKEDWVRGCALILTSYIAWSGWLILQAMLCKIYPAPLSLNTIICFFAALQSSFLAVFFGRNPTIWRLHWNEQLLTTIYCGVVNSALLYYLQTWCISREGPVFAAMFSPLQLLIVALFSALAFAERLHLTSLFGAFLIVTGLYCVLWGKRLDSFADETQASPDTKFVEISLTQMPTNDDLALVKGELSRTSSN